LRCLASTALHVVLATSLTACRAVLATSLTQLFDVSLCCVTTADRGGPGEHDREQVARYLQGTGKTSNADADDNLYSDNDNNSNDSELGDNEEQQFTGYDQHEEVEFLSQSRYGAVGR
jgi:hypothetical protein